MCTKTLPENSKFFSNHKVQTLVWEECPSGTTLSVISIRSGPIQARTSKTSTQTSDTSQDQMKQSRCCKPSAAWPRNVSVNSATTTKSSSTTGVGRIALSCSVAFADDQISLADISTQGKSDRAISPNATNEEDRRELIARQHRALYGSENSQYLEGGSFGDESHTPRPSNPTSGNTSAGGRGPSPRTYDPYSIGQNQAQAAIAEAGAQLSANDQSQQAAPKGPSPKPQQQQQRSRADSTSSPASNPPSQSFSLFESAAQQSSRTSTSSPGGSPPRQAKTSAPSGVAPIGTRPAQSQATNPIINSKRSTTPSHSPLGFGFAQNTDSLNPISNNGNERSTSAASNPTSSGNKDAGMAWGTGSGVWGNNNNKSLQASVWG